MKKHCKFLISSTTQFAWISLTCMSLDCWEGGNSYRQWEQATSTQKGSDPTRNQTQELVTVHHRTAKYAQNYLPKNCCMTTLCPHSPPDTHIAKKGKLPLRQSTKTFLLSFVQHWRAFTFNLHRHIIWSSAQLTQLLKNGNQYAGCTRAKRQHELLGYVSMWEITWKNKAVNHQWQNGFWH